MAVIEIKGLEGLKGLSGLSDEDKKAWIEANKSRLPNPEKVSPIKYNSFADRIYRNDLFRQRFNDEALLQSMTPEERDSYYQESLMNEYTQNRYGNDPNYFEIENLTPEGKLDLVEKGYLSDEDIEKEYKSNIESINELEDNSVLKFLSEAANLSRPATAIGTQETSLNAAKESFDTFKDTQYKVKKDLLDSVIAKDNERKREIVSNESLMLQSELQKGLNNGDLTKEDIDK